jgi:hypothetical protein
MYAQLIVAGNHYGKDYFRDVVPDSGIFYDNTSWGIYPIDINNDNIVDVELWASYMTSPGGSQCYCYMRMLNNTEGAFSNFDSCFLYNGNYLNGIYCAHPFHYGDSINENAVWSNQNLYLARSWSSFNTYYCFSHSFDFNDTSYAGVRIFVDHDTLYGWIKVAHVYPYLFMLLEYAGNRTQAQLERGMVYAYPVPATTDFTLQIDSETPAEIILYDMEGRKLLTQSFIHTVTVDIARFSKGVYFYEVRNSETAPRTGKVVKQ